MSALAALVLGGGLGGLAAAPLNIEAVAWLYDGVRVPLSAPA